MIHHAGLLARWTGGHWRGVLIEGESGSGKSDLALRALDDGWSLVADDRTLLAMLTLRSWEEETSRMLPVVAEMRGRAREIPGNLV